VLCEIWQEVLSVEQVGVTDNFFMLGGHSLIVIKMLTMVKYRLGITVETESIFSSPRLLDFAYNLQIELPDLGCRA
jgi:hypothetical protein